MKVYITRDSYLTGIIEERIGHQQTGHPNEIQLNGIKTSRYITSQRVRHKPDWHESYDEAVAQAIKEANRMILSLEDSIKRDQERLEKIKLNLAKFLSEERVNG